MFYKKSLLLFCFLSLVTILYGHPHLFIKPSIEIVIDTNVINGIKITWEWDKWWSEDVINECDIDKNGILDKKEIKLVYKTFFIGIKDFNYFTEIYINNNKIKINNILDFTANVNKDKIVTYDFIIPIGFKFEAGTKIKICFNDKTIYTAFDENIVLIPIKDHNFENLKMSDCGYYGVQIIFDIF